MAAAMAAGLCARLDPSTLAQAIALAGDLSSGTEQYVYESGNCDTKDLIAGFAARNGVFAVNLASAGFYGPQGVLDGEYGFFRAFGEGFDPGLFDDLGEHFAIVTTGFKPHGGCRHTHQAVDAVQSILRESALNTADIERVEIQTYDYALRPSFRIDPNPASRDVAGLSIRVATALALVQGSAWPDDFQRWDDPEVRRLRQLIDLTIEPEIESNYPNQNGSRVLVNLSDGSIREGYVPFAQGEPEFPMSGEQLRLKFDVLTRKILSEEQRAAIYAMCAHLEDIGDISELMELTTAN
jgi:2-methylcitrate dehydratase PrpD